MPRQAGVFSSASGAEALALSDAELVAGVLAVSEWRSLGGSEVLGSADLVRRVVAAVSEAAEQNRAATA